jgi:hypothetical protein
MTVPVPVRSAPGWYGASFVGGVATASARPPDHLSCCRRRRCCRGLLGVPVHPPVLAATSPCLPGQVVPSGRGEMRLWGRCGSSRMCPNFLVGCRPLQGDCLLLVAYLHLEPTAAPENPGPEIDLQDVCRSRLGGNRPVRTSQFRVRRGHGFPAVDVGGVQVHDVVVLRPFLNYCDELVSVPRQVRV